VQAVSGSIFRSEVPVFNLGGRLSIFFRGALLRAAGRIFCLGEDGLLAEFELTPKGVVTRQRVRLFEAHSSWTLPALHKGLLYVAQNEREVRAGKRRRIICYDFRAE
jgi:hypothetical protein